LLHVLSQVRSEGREQDAVGIVREYRNPRQRR
jgi:hypothetical protein